MDIKASARSQRAKSQKAKSKFNTKHSHSQSHSHSQPQPQKRNESHESQKPQHPKQTETLQVPEPSKALPSNWDRYEDSHSSGAEDDFISKGEETVRVKSKGADYSYLLSQFQEQTGFDAHLPEDTAGISSMLYVRGHNLLSWGDDDNFIVSNDNMTSDYEASFLSVDLHGLASQLAKLDLSKRLFIEDDKLPAELRSSGSQATTHQPVEGKEQVHSNENERGVLKVQSDRELELPPFKFPVIDKSTEEVNLKDDCEIQKNASSREGILGMEKAVTFPESVGRGMVPSSGEEVSMNFSAYLDSQARVGAVSYKAESITPFDKTSSIDAKKSCMVHLENNQKPTEHTMHDEKAGSAKFEAATAEAELDALLDELDGPSEVSIFKEHGTSSDPFFKESSSYKGTQPFQVQMQGLPNLLSRTDNTVDGLLGETVKRGPKEVNVKNIHDTKAVVAGLLPPRSSTSSHVNVPKVSEDDFDAWLDSI